MKLCLSKLSSLFSESVPARRQSCSVSGVSHGLEACERREYLSAMPVVPEIHLQPFQNELPAAEVSSDFTGTWSSRNDRFYLEQRRDRVKGTYVGTNVEAGAKIRAKVEGDNLVGTIRGRADFPGFGVGKFKIDLDATRTRANQLQAELDVTFDGRRIGGANLFFTRVN